EMDITQLVDNFYQAFKLPAGTSISDLYTSRKFDKLNNFSIKYFGLDLHSTADIKPLFILAKYSEIISNHSGKALDAILFEYALLRNLPVSGLETVVRQMEIAELIPLDMQVKMLSSA
ncbi:MAG TPA: TraB/GumN family protein, partial [Saprospiraceae bacterium]|nr:TraB/GumN family protein [Saprospiraceae bacterium]